MTNRSPENTSLIAQILLSTSPASSPIRRTTPSSRSVATPDAFLGQAIHKLPAGASLAAAGAKRRSRSAADCGNSTMTSSSFRRRPPATATPSGRGSSQRRISSGAEASATRAPGLMHSFCASGVPEYPAMASSVPFRLSRRVRGAGLALAEITGCGPIHARKVTNVRDSEHAIRSAAEIAARFIRGEDSPPTPRREPEALLRDLPLSLPRQGAPAGEVVRRLAQVIEATPSSSSRRFFSQLFGGRDLAATMADMVTAVTNSSMYTFKAAGVQVLIEREIIGKLAGMVGFAGGDGIFAPGGSMSNLAAMMVAREEMLPGTRDEGVGPAGSGGAPVVYASSEAHYSIVKAMNILGLGRRNLRKISVDSAGRMMPDELGRAIRADIARGLRPIMIVATAGTTVQGAFDPLPELADIAREHDLWLHVDGAFGASVLLSERHRHLMRGCELADSVVWDAHKVLGAPLTCSVALTKRRGLFERHIGEAADYLFQADDDELNPGTRSLQCGRRNDALKLWCAWQAHGDEGYAQRIDRLFEQAALVRSIVEEDPALILSCPPQSLTVCFEVAGRSSVEICERLDREGTLKISYGIVAGRAVVRMVCVNPDLADDDLREAMAVIKAAGDGLPDADNGVEKLETQAMG
jgi:glutamate/tyrosine decarboxylase-like PLP-dependent enzyme